MSTVRPSYWDYLKLDQLLDLQSGLGDSDEELIADELHFIMIHQVYELWFKLLLRSLRLARNSLSTPEVPEEQIPHVVHHLRRVSAILQTSVDQFRVMETLTPQDFLSFRDKLTPASGFQSFQMREIEIVMGLEDQQRIQYGETDPLKHIQSLAETSPAAKLAWSRIVSAREETSLLTTVQEWLHRTPIQGSRPDDADDDTNVTRFLDDYLAASASNRDANLERMVDALGEEARPRLQSRYSDLHTLSRDFLFAEDVVEGDRKRIRRTRAALLFIESYRELPLLAWPRLLLDLIVEMEEYMVLFRSRHARMVERLIGRRIGTGGSSGVDYLDKTASYRIFRDLWAIRTVLLPKQALPPLLNADFYGFARN